MVSAGDRHPSEALSTSSLPTLASTGSCARLRPASPCFQPLDTAIRDSLQQYSYLCGNYPRAFQSFQGIKCSKEVFTKRSILCMMQAFLPQDILCLATVLKRRRFHSCCTS